MSLPLYAGTLDAAIYGLLIACLTTKGVRKRSIAGIVISALVTLGVIGYIIEARERDMPKEARWPLFFALPLAIAMVFLIMGSADAASDGKERRGAIGLLHALPILHFVVFIIAFFFVFQFGAIELKLDEAPFWVLFVLWALMCAMLWITLSFKARNAKIPEKPDEFSAQKRHAVRLFDDASHYRDPDAEPGQPDRYFPSGRRPIMRLWWEGTGKMAVRSDRYGSGVQARGGRQHY